MKTTHTTLLTLSVTLSHIFSVQAFPTTRNTDAEVDVATLPSGPPSSCTPLGSDAASSCEAWVNAIQSAGLAENITRMYEANTPAWVSNFLSEAERLRNPIEELTLVEVDLNEIEVDDETEDVDDEHVEEREEHEDASMDIHEVEENQKRGKPKMSKEEKTCKKMKGKFVGGKCMPNVKEEEKICKRLKGKMMDGWCWITKQKKKELQKCETVKKICCATSWLVLGLLGCCLPKCQ